MENVFKLATDITPKRKIPDTKKILEAGKESVVGFINEYLRQTPQFKLLVTADNTDQLKIALGILFKDNADLYRESFNSPNIFLNTKGEFEETCFFVPPEKPDEELCKNTPEVAAHYMKECDKNRALIHKSIMLNQSSLYLTQAKLVEEGLARVTKKISPKELCFLSHVWVHMDERESEYDFQLIRCFFAPSGTHWTVTKDKPND